MSLVLVIEYLSGLCFAAIDSDSDAPDWPPQPDRIFSALVAAWAARGRSPAERKALEWLERQPAPVIAASAASPRTAPLSFVPPNDPQSGRTGNVTVLPSYRRRQARRFPAARPHEPQMRLIWTGISPSPEELINLKALACDTAYVGHSTSLTRCTFSETHDARVNGAMFLPAQRWVYPGRLQELIERYDEFVKSRGKRGRPLPGSPVRDVNATKPEGAPSFAGRWLLLEHADGEMPDLRAAALVAKAIRDALLAGYNSAGLGSSIPEVVSGHTIDGQPARQPHLAIVPLAVAGFPYADGHIVGFAIIPPRGSDILDDADFRKALRAVAPLDGSTGRRVMRVWRNVDAHASAFSVSLTLTSSFGDKRRSLDPQRYIRRSRLFGTVTPIVLDRHLKEKGRARIHEITSQIEVACRNIGLPNPHHVRVDKHSAVEGVPSAYPSPNSPRWMNWRLPEPLRTRQLTHAVIRFERPVEGPVILGAGRYVGLGLCLPLKDREGWV